MALRAGEVANSIQRRIWPMEVIAAGSKTAAILTSYPRRSMETNPPAMSLLEELDRRQDEVLLELDKLEQRLTDLLTEYSGGRPAPLKLHPLDEAA